MNKKNDIREYLIETVTVWQKLKMATKPILIYGMGNGADKIIDECILRGIKIYDIFASDEFVRGQVFRGFKVFGYDEMLNKYKDFIILIAFAFYEDNMFDKFFKLISRHEVYIPDVPVFGETIFDEVFINNYTAQLTEVLNLLNDNTSKQVYLDILNYKISGKPQYLISSISDKTEGYSLLNLTKSEIYVDVGAYNGDTIEELLQETSGFSKIIAIEPDSKNFKKLSSLVDKLGLSETSSLYNIGAGKERSQIQFDRKAGRNSSFGTGTQIAEIDSLDNILNGYKATLIKYDTEGFEYDALIGSFETIRRLSPKLIVSLYHKTEDIFKLPLLINKINPLYKLDIRRHKYVPAWDINLYVYL